MAVDSTDGANQSSQLLNDILDLAHPLMAEAIYLAALPHWYNLELFTAIRNTDDGRNEGLIPRLAQYSFIIPTSFRDPNLFHIHSTERRQLNVQWIRREQEAYLAAHAHAFAFWESRSVQEYPTRDFEHLYHHFFVDLGGAVQELISYFRIFVSQRRLGGIEHLLAVSDEAYELLQLLGGEPPPDNETSPGDPPPLDLRGFEQLLRFLKARMAQLQGRWDASLDLLLELRETRDLSPRLLPYVTRAYAEAQRESGLFVEAIDELKSAIDLFHKQAEQDPDRQTEIEQAMTGITLGETYVRFAQTVRRNGGQERNKFGLLQIVQRTIDFVSSLPLILYLWFYLGGRVWHPRFWPTLRNLDWIVARLFALGMQQYQKADPTLERLGLPFEGVIADERLAFLYLEMGDSAQARDQFENLLRNVESPVAGYRRAQIYLGMAEANIRLENADRALQALRPALPELEKAADKVSLAQAYRLRAEAHFLAGQFDQAMADLTEAHKRYRLLGDAIAATHLQERMEVLAKVIDVPPAIEERITSAGEILPHRQYTVGYRHPALVTFRWVVVILLPLVLVVALLLTINLSTNVNLAPEYSFRAAPILNPGDIQPTELSQGISSASIFVDPKPRAILFFAIGALAIYLGFSVVLGVLAIILTPLQVVQKRTQASTVMLDGEGITVGKATAAALDEGNGQIRWSEITGVVQANTQLWRTPSQEASSFAVESAGARLVITGSTDWYPALQQRVLNLVPETVRTTKFDYSIFRSKLGQLYILNLVLFGVIILLARISQDSEQIQALLWNDFPGTPYSLVDLYPYLLMGLILAPLWWSVVRAMQVAGHIGTQDRFLLGAFVLALLLVLFMISSGFRPLLTVPDLYPPLIVIVTLVSVSWALWQLRVRPERVTPAWLRWTVALSTGVVCVLMGSLLWRESWAYHHLIIGNTQRDMGQAAFQEGKENMAADHFGKAMMAYEASLRIGQRSIWGISSEWSLRYPWGIPTNEHHTWILALKNAAALHAQAGSGETAIQLNDRLLQITDRKDQVYAWRALARQRAATQMTANNEHDLAVVNKDQYARALFDFAQAITEIEALELKAASNVEKTQLTHQKAQYFLWRGITRHVFKNYDSALNDYQEALKFTPATVDMAALRERAYSGIGWIRYDRKAYTEAIKAFTQATGENPEQAEAWLGLGYANYAVGAETKDKARAIEYLGAASDAWLTAHGKDPSDPIVLISLGTLNWKLGGLMVRKADQCAAYTQSIDYFTQVINSPNLRVQSPQDLAFTHRTIGQVTWLLSNCAEVDSAQYDSRPEVMRRAVEAYAEAIRWDTDVPKYHQMHGRLTYAWWSVQGAAKKEDALLYQAAGSMYRSLEMGLFFDSTTRRLYGWTLDALVPVALDEAAAFIARDEVDQAVDRLSQIIKYRPEATSSALRIINYALDDPNNTGIRPQLEAAKVTLMSVNPTWIFLQAQARLASAQELINAGADDLEILVVYAGKINEMEVLFGDGLSQVQDSLHLRPATDALLHALSLALEESVEDAILTQYRRHMARLTRINAERPTVTGLTALGTIALALDDVAQAAEYYATALRLDVESDHASGTPLYSVLNDWVRLWKAQGSQADALLQAFEEQVQAQRMQHLSLSSREYYWGVLSWYTYRIGQAAFRAGDETGARHALDSATIYAQKARGGWVSSDDAPTYLPEAAWGWYHIKRGDDRWGEGDIEGALADYEAAIDAIQPNENESAFREQLTARWKSGLAAVAASQFDRAAAYYQQGLRQAATLGKLDNTISAGRSLRSFLLENPEIDVVDLYDTIIAAENIEAIDQLENQDLYWRYRAEFGLNYIYRLFTERPDADAIHLAVVEQVIADMKQASAINAAGHQERSDFFTAGILGWLYRQRGNEYFDDGAFQRAFRDYQTAIESTNPVNADAKSVALDAMLRAGVAALHISYPTVAQIKFTEAFDLIKNQSNEDDFSDEINSAIALLSDIQSNNSEVTALRDRVRLQLEAY